MKNVILGGGISGLIALHYIKDSVLFESSDKLASDFLDNTFPKYIHCCEETLDFFKELNIEPVIKNFSIGILYNGKIIDFFDKDINKELKQEIYNVYCIKKYENILNGKMNGFLSGERSKQYIENKEDLISCLVNKYRGRIALKHRADQINLKEKYIHFNNDSFLNDFRGKYQNLISTLPIDIFSRITDKNYECKILKLCVATITTRSEDINKYDFIYVPDGQYSFHRINNNKKKGYFIFEYNEDKTCDSSLELFSCRYFNSNYDFLKTNFQFAISKNKIKEEGVKFLGRFSTGDYKIKLNEVINNARQIAKNV